ncbi:MAG TPA: multicopper oxidase [Myxococcales bacterium]|nr:multicopper oxidase [Myxococcales bacterium]
MSSSRRQLLWRGAGLAVWTGARRLLGADQLVPMHAMKVQPAPIKRGLYAAGLPRFVDALPIPSIAKPEASGKYRIAMREIETQVHRDLKPTRCWSYGTTVPGPTFEVRSGKSVDIEWKNELPAKHFLPIDHSLCGAGKEVPEVRTVVHVHGARVPPQSDGYPERWFPPGKSRVVHYPNQQEAAGLWYHDHAMGIERLNQYAGLFGAYLIRDEHEDALGLPRAPYEVPLFIFDRIFDVDGQLQYPTSGMDDSPWISEMYGDAILVNGKLAPDLEVEPRAYRFRVFNSSNARFLLLSLSDGTAFQQIGSDQGLLPAPVPLKAFSLAPAERADVLIDFSPLAGKELVLMNQAFQLMRFRVKAAPVAVKWQPPAKLREVPRIPRSASVKTRTLGLDEYEDPATHAMFMLLDKKRWHDPVSEKPVLGSTEIWELVNYTGDVHPIHLHLVRFQILERQKFDIDGYRFEKKMQLIGDPFPPELGEVGWKDTVQAQPEMVTRIIVHFEGYAGRYVWHCHVLEHAANEMMRPFEVLPAKTR